jgi:hypothetical protein
MYGQAKKVKRNGFKVNNNPLVQKKKDVKQGFKFEDNRAETVKLTNAQEEANKRPQAEITAQLMLNEQVAQRDSYTDMLKSRPKPPQNRRLPTSTAAVFGPYGHGTIGVPKPQMERLKKRIMGIKVGGSSVVSNITLFGSRAGSKFIGSGRPGEKVRSGQGPHGPMGVEGSDVDMYVEVLVKYWQDPRKKPWILNRIKQAVADYKKDARMHVDLHITQSLNLSMKNMDDPNPANVRIDKID